MSVDDDKFFFRHIKSDGRILYHCEDGPAIKWQRGKEWYMYGQTHREDGPAVEYTNGTKCWYLFGKRFSEEEFLKRIYHD